MKVNSSSSSIASGDAIDVLNAVAFIFLIMFTFVGNLLLLVALLGSRKLRHTANHFTLNLAVTSFLVAGTVMPLRVLSFINKELWASRPIMCEAYCTCFVLCCAVTVLALAVACLDRYLSVLNSHTYLKFVSSSYGTVGLIASCWLVSLVLALGPANFSVQHIHSTYDCKLIRIYQPIYIYSFVAVGVLIPVSFILLLHMGTIKKTVGRLRTVDIQNHGSKPKNLDSSESTSFTKEAQRARVIINISLSFILFWLPRCIFLLVDNSQRKSIHEVADGLTEILTYCFPASLPLLYATWSVEIKNVFVRMLCPFGVIRQRHDRERYRLVTPHRVAPLGSSQYT